LKYLDDIFWDSPYMQLTILNENISDAWGFSGHGFDYHRSRKMNLDLQEMSQIKKFLAPIAAGLDRSPSPSSGYTIIEVD
jgi:hypothetical protein